MDKLEFEDIHDTLIEPFLGQFFSPATAESLEPLAKEVGRIIYQNDSITINWGLVVAALVSGLLLLLKLFFGLTLFDVMDAMTGASYGTGYGYAAPASSYTSPSSGYDSPSSGYAAPASYSARTSFGEDVDEVKLTPEQKALYPELAKLQDDINQLKENEFQLRQQIFYNNQGEISSAGSNQITYSY